MNAAAHSSLSRVWTDLSASVTSAGSRPMSGYCPTSARWIASVLISSMVRSERCCARAGELSSTMLDNAVEANNVNIAKRLENLRVGPTNFDTRSFLSSFRKRWGRWEADPVLINPWQSENKFQAQLNRAAAAGADDGVGGGDVWRGATATERLNGRIVESETVLTAVRIGEIGGVENVEDLGPKLGAKAFAKMPVLGHGEVDVTESGVGEGVAPHVAELSEWRWKHDGVALRITTEEGQ